jgi:hypothetical protein
VVLRRFHTHRLIMLMQKIIILNRQITFCPALWLIHTSMTPACGNTRQALILTM